MEYNHLKEDSRGFHITREICLMIFLGCIGLGSAVNYFAPKLIDIKESRKGGSWRKKAAVAKLPSGSLPQQILSQLKQLGLYTFLTTEKCCTWLWMEFRLFKVLTEFLFGKITLGCLSIGERTTSLAESVPRWIVTGVHNYHSSNEEKHHLLKPVLLPWFWIEQVVFLCVILIGSALTVAATSVFIRVELCRCSIYPNQSSTEIYNCTIRLSHRSNEHFWKMPAYLFFMASLAVTINYYDLHQELGPRGIVCMCKDPKGYSGKILRHLRTFASLMVSITTATARIFYRIVVVGGVSTFVKISNRFYDAWKGIASTVVNLKVFVVKLFNNSQPRIENSNEKRNKSEVPENDLQVVAVNRPSPSITYQTITDSEIADVSKNPTDSKFGNDNKKVGFSEVLRTGFVRRNDDDTNLTKNPPALASYSGETTLSQEGVRKFGKGKTLIVDELDAKRHIRSELKVTKSLPVSPQTDEKRNAGTLNLLKTGQTKPNNDAQMTSHPTFETSITEDHTYKKIKTHKSKVIMVTNEPDRKIKVRKPKKLETAVKKVLKGMLDEIEKTEATEKTQRQLTDTKRCVDEKKRRKQCVESAGRKRKERERTPSTQEKNDHNAHLKKHTKVTKVVTRQGTSVGSPSKTSDLQIVEVMVLAEPMAVATVSQMDQKGNVPKSKKSNSDYQTGVINQIETTERTDKRKIAQDRLAVAKRRAGEVKGVMNQIINKIETDQRNNEVEEVMDRIVKDIDTKEKTAAGTKKLLAQVVGKIETEDGASLRKQGRSDPAIHKDAVQGAASLNGPAGDAKKEHRPSTPPKPLVEIRMIALDLSITDNHLPVSPVDLCPSPTADYTGSARGSEHSDDSGYQSSGGEPSSEAEITHVKGHSRQSSGDGSILTQSSVSTGWGSEGFWATSFEDEDPHSQAPFNVMLAYASLGQARPGRSISESNIHESVGGEEEWGDVSWNPPRRSRSANFPMFSSFE